MIKDLLEEIARGPSSDELCPEPEGLREAMRLVMAGEVVPEQLAALLMGLRCRGEQAEHLNEVVRVMLENALEFPYDTGEEPLYDTCGTGGDYHGTINVSTGAALLAAAAGLKVAKHGNRSVSSKSGSADVLEKLGIQIDCSPAVSAAMLRDHNFCFLFARTYHPAMKHAAPTRAALRFRTIFNLAGPLSNPAGANRQLVGVAEHDMIYPMAEALRLLGRQRALVVHGRNREDEISVTTVTEGIELREDGTLHDFYFDPAAMDIRVSEMADLVVNDPDDSAAKLKEILEGADNPMADAVNVNFGATLYLAGQAGDIGSAVQMAYEFQRTGQAAELLPKLAEASRAG